MNRNDKEFLVQKIRTQYTEKQHTELDTLVALDKKVKKPAMVFSYLVGSLSALILGAGMSLVMTDLGATLGVAEPMLPGVALGIVGLALALLNYPIYQRLLASRRKQYAGEILKLSRNILGA